MILAIPVQGGYEGIPQCPQGEEEEVDIILNHIGRGNQEEVNKYFQQQRDPNQRFQWESSGKDGMFGLFLAAKLGHTDIVKLFLDNKADPNQTYQGYSPLHIAAKNGHLGAVTALVDSSAVDINKLCNKVTALYRAAEDGHYTVVEFLLNKGANPTLGWVRRLNSKKPLDGAMTSKGYAEGTDKYYEYEKIIDRLNTYEEKVPKRFLGEYITNFFQRKSYIPLVRTISKDEAIVLEMSNMQISPLLGASK